MKMHVLIIGLAVLYWAVMSMAQTAFTGAEPCAAEAGGRLAAPVSSIAPEPVIDPEDADTIAADRIYRLAALSEDEAATAEPNCGR